MMNIKSAHSAISECHLHIMTYECGKCKSKCKHSKTKKYAYAKLFIKDINGSSYNVTMFNNTLSSLNLQEAHSIEEHLLTIDSIKVQVNSNNIVTAVIQ